jgi:hypothetical protein
MKRAAVVAAIACDVLLLASLLLWWLAPAYPQLGLPPQAAPMTVIASLACGAVALIAARRTQQVALFLATLVAVLAAAWLWSQLQGDVGVGRTLLLR